MAVILDDLVHGLLVSEGVLAGLLLGSGGVRALDFQDPNNLTRLTCLTPARHHPIRLTEDEAERVDPNPVPRLLNKEVRAQAGAILLPGDGLMFDTPLHRWALGTGAPLHRGLLGPPRLGR